MISKNILEVHGKASNLAINAQLGTFPACFKSFILMFEYYNRLNRIESDNESRNSLLRSAFIEDKKLNKSLNKTLNSIKQKFELSPLDISDRDFKYHLFNFFERKTLKQFQNIRKNKTGKLHFLSNIPRIFKLQNYLEFPLSKEHRSFLTKIRISAHSLNIETGRYNSTPREQRLCKFCPSSVEDEKHFILHYPKYQNIRNSYNTLFQSIRTDDDLIR
jgi:hypothetical protein